MLTVVLPEWPERRPSCIYPERFDAGALLGKLWHNHVAR